MKKKLIFFQKNLAISHTIIDVGKNLCDPIFNQIWNYKKTHLISYKYTFIIKSKENHIILIQ